VRATAASLGLQCLVAHPRIELRDGKAGEAAAREARYEALGAMARAAACTRVATAHTSTDQFETTLINWLRGAAVGGLGGMAPQRRLDDGLLLVRPLLGATREATHSACRSAGHEWREDASNESRQYLRNRVRHDLVPLLAQIGGRPPSVLERQSVRAAAILRDDIDALDSLARRELAALTVARRDRLIALAGAGFVALHPALQRRVLRCAVLELHGDVRDLDAARVETARRHIVAGGRRRVWQWRRGMNVEWTGAMAGNRVRVWVVETDNSM
jgi:tRNA(Ile)-lysidine synthase